MAYQIVLIPGDGIGPEVTAAARRVVEAAGVAVEWQVAQAGQVALDTLGSPLPAETLEAVRNAQTPRSKARPPRPAAPAFAA